MAFDVNSFCIERFIYGFAEDSNGNLLYLANQIENPQLSCDGEEVTKSDAQGSTIASISRAKTCTFDWESSVFDLNIFASINGTTKEVASSLSKITAPKVETITITESNKTAIVLQKSVKAVAGKYDILVATLTTDGSLAKNFTQGSEVAEGVFTYTSSSKTIAFNSGDLVVGDKVFIKYEYETDAAVQVVNSADDFPQAAKTTFLIKGFDICDQNKAIYAYLIFPNAKMSTSTNVTLDLESTIPVSMTCAYDYCSDDKELYRFVIAE